ncbi:hypothetical protein ENUP19_0162G0005 [Entamoeba nuttalli]|uniref:Uncharacterized protein n=2 Tax=Entamoeba nuttalli TaxID=412467 RepID=K2GJJ3_ENTNP|nr:hypothetical protein ENU1_003380 [Entamoeba nuttalli P19]EKE42961.1 hypothetical protein ENU1_003380 [Entamoeba nuttalli P19]|eukprot:XP_008854705.1 hypothetical protein ENU1_003380 [Entamoeba nuttalli P19]
MTKEFNTPLIFPTHPIRTSIENYNYNLYSKEQRPSDKRYEECCNVNLRVKTIPKKKDQILKDEIKPSKFNTRPSLPSFNSSSSLTSTLRLRTDTTKTRPSTTSFSDNAIQTCTLLGHVRTNDVKKQEEIKYEWEESKKSFKTYEACQQAILIGLLIINDYEIEINKEIKRKKKFPMLDILSIKKSENNQLVSCGLNEFIAKSMKDTETAKETETKRSDYKQRKRNILTMEFMMKLMSNEKLVMELVKPRLSGTLLKNEISFIVSFTLNMFIKPVHLNQQDILKIGKHINNLITRIVLTSPPQRSIILTPYHYIISSIFIQFFRDSLEQFDKAIHFKESDNMSLTNTYPFQNLQPEFISHFQNLDFSFIRIDTLQFILKTF